MSLRAPKKRGRPPLLTHDGILAATMELLTEAPVEQFTMQRVSELLNVAPMTLYGYYPSRDALLQAAAEKLFDQLDLSAMQDAASWSEMIRVWCHSIRTHLHSLPNLFRLITEPAQLTGAWLEASSPLVEALMLAELSTAQVALFTRWIGRTLVGMLLIESSFDRDVYHSISEHPEKVFQQLSPVAGARLQTLIPHVLGQDEERQFELTISSIIRAVEDARPIHASRTDAIDVAVQPERQN